MRSAAWVLLVILGMLSAALAGDGLHSRAEDPEVPAPGDGFKRLLACAEGLRGIRAGVDVDLVLVSREEMQSHVSRLWGVETRRSAVPVMRVLQLGAASRSSALPKPNAMYDLEARRILVQGDALGRISTDAAVVHECVHFLDDQEYAIGKRLLGEMDSDAAFALRCLVEGCAEYVERRYTRSADPAAPVLRASRGEALNGPSATAGAIEDSQVAESGYSWYSIGLNFVEQACGVYGIARMSDLYADPPCTQEQILHPDKYLENPRDHAMCIESPSSTAPLPGRAVSRTSHCGLGEVDVLCWFFDIAAAAAAARPDGLQLGKGYVERAAAGWDGVSADLYQNESEGFLCALASAWDSPGDAAEASSFFSCWAAAKTGGETNLIPMADGGRRDFQGQGCCARVLLSGSHVLAVLTSEPDSLEKGWQMVAETRFTRSVRERPALEVGPGVVWFTDEAWEVAGSAPAVIARGDWARVRISIATGGEYPLEWGESERDLRPGHVRR